MSNKVSIIAALEKEQMSKEIPDFSPGDTVVVQVKVKEGTRERLQAFEGVVLAKRNRQLNSAFTVRKISNGIGVERTFQTYSPLVDSIEVKRRGAVRRAKLYYFRERSGRSARIKEKLGKATTGCSLSIEEGDPMDRLFCCLLFLWLGALFNRALFYN